MVYPVHIKAGWAQNEARNRLMVNPGASHAWKTPDTLVCMHSDSVELHSVGHFICCFHLIYAEQLIKN